jgi:hypothetical protein
VSTHVGHDIDRAQKFHVRRTSYYTRRYFARSKLFHLESVTRAIFLCPVCSPGIFLNLWRGCCSFNSHLWIKMRHTNTNQNANGERGAQLVNDTYKSQPLHSFFSSVWVHDRGCCWRSRNKITVRITATPSQLLAECVFRGNLLPPLVSRSSEFNRTHSLARTQVYII